MQKSTMPTFILFIGLRTLTYSSLTHNYMDLNMHEKCSRHLNTVPEALVVTLNVLDASAEFFHPPARLSSPSRLSLHPASLAPLPGEPLNPGEEHIVSTCLSAHARWQAEKKNPTRGSGLFTLIELCYSAHCSHLPSLSDSTQLWQWRLCKSSCAN